MGPEIIKTGVFKTCWRILFRPHLFSMLLLAGLAFLVAVSAMATIALTVPLMNAVQGHAVPSEILPPLIWVSMAAIANSFLLFGAQYASVAVGQKIANRIKIGLLDKMLHGRYDWLVNRGRGSLLFDINNIPPAVVHVVDLFGRMSVSLFQAFLVVGLMFYLSWKATLVLGFLSLLWWGKLRSVFSGMSARFGRKIYELGETMGRLDVDVIDGIKVVKAHHLEKEVLSREEELLESQKRPKLYSDMLTRGIVLLNEALAGLAVIFLGFSAFVFGWIQISFPEMVAFMFAIKRASPSLGMFHSMYIAFYGELKNLQTIDETLHHIPQEKSGNIPAPPMRAIQFEAVSFGYPSKEKPALEGISCEMRRGEITAIVGPSGAGKSTLVNLLLRFYDPLEGVIRADGVDLSQFDLADWRKKIGFVSQDVFLFNGTLLENILLWKKGVSREEAESAAKKARIHDFILSLPEGYDTKVGDRGLKLSGGQCQRIAIAREILKQPHVIIFDEATSALDNLTEKEVYDAILALRNHSIVIVIAHRLTTIREASQIIVLESGKIEAIGSHELLMKESGMYARLNNIFRLESAHP